jgi:hypothetical protein
MSRTCKAGLMLVISSVPSMPIWRSVEMGAAGIDPANLLFRCALFYQRIDIVLGTKDQTLMARKQLPGAYGDSSLGTHPQTGDADGVYLCTALLPACSLLEGLTQFGQLVLCTTTLDLFLAFAANQHQLTLPGPPIATQPAFKLCQFIR